MPRRARSWVGILRRSPSAQATRPPEALRRPITLFMSVVLPAPLRPMRPTMAPSGTSSETSRRMCIAAIETLRFSTLSMVTYDVAPHLRIVEHHLRRSVGDDAAVVESEHALREAAHHFHVVLDEEDSRPFGARRVEHHLHDAELLVGGNPAGWLIEQQHARLRHHGEGDVEQLPRSTREHLRVAVAVGGEPEALEQVLGNFTRGTAEARHGCIASRPVAGEAGVPEDDAE